MGSGGGWTSGSVRFSRSVRFRLKKVRKLLESKHVYATKETYGRDISAKGHSQQGKNVCDITIQLNPVSREIIASACNCRYGARGDCKHAAAVAFFFSEDEVATCTSLPQAWRKPLRKPTLKDKAPISERFGGRPPTLFPPSYIISHFEGINSPFTNVLRQMNRCQVDLECERLLQDMVGAAVGIVEEVTVQELLPSAEMPVYHALEGTGTYPILRSIGGHTFFYNIIVCSSPLSLCMATLQQSKCKQGKHGCGHTAQVLQ
ncbi:hypothetical protein HPB47_006572 [Ixodes persulcatus]|uniref:Uncharacterized protein n=1 Tax=Ixodes persulcatus TaxID=34615 RepID=A0AC60P9S7_IXOPE|nr:hypothetical protein HPB47_006572 [Ixodes persulcatus]